jgi:hypothetical protein
MHRATVENLFRDSKPGACGIFRISAGEPGLMWGALLAVAMAAWLHQDTGATAGEDILYGMAYAAARP